MCLAEENHMTEWPSDKINRPATLHPYFHLREISAQDYLIFKGDRVLITPKLRSHIKRTLHSLYIGMDVCLWRTRECF